MNVKFSVIDPEADDVYTLEAFQDNVKYGCFNDYDGIGVLATKDTMSNIEISPSQALSFQYPQWATHIVWFNK